MLQIRTYKRYGVHYEHGLTFSEDFTYLTCLFIALLIWLWASGFALGRLSGQATWPNRIPFSLCCSGFVLFVSGLLRQYHLAKSALIFCSCPSATAVFSDFYHVPGGHLGNATRFSVPRSARLDDAGHRRCGRMSDGSSHLVAVPRGSGHQRDEHGSFECICLVYEVDALLVSQHAGLVRACHFHIHSAESRKMNSKLAALLLACALSSSPRVHSQPKLPVKSQDTLVPSAQRKTAPDFTLLDNKGAPLTLSTYKGKVVLLDFWATWCHGCKQELPWYIDFDRRYRREGLAVIGVSMDDGGMGVVRPFLAQKQIRYRVVIRK